MGSSLCKMLLSTSPPPKKNSALEIQHRNKETPKSPDLEYSLSEISEKGRPFSFLEYDYYSLFAAKKAVNHY